MNDEIKEQNQLRIVRNATARMNALVRRRRYEEAEETARHLAGILRCWALNEKFRSPIVETAAAK